MSGVSIANWISIISFLINLLQTTANDNITQNKTKELR